MGMVKSKKLEELCQWEHISEVNNRLDAGENPKSVHEWITSNGFNISHPLIYEYARRRKLAAMDKVLAEQYITAIDTEALRDGIKRVPIIDIRPEAMAVKRLKNELDALEAIIQLGYNNLLNLPVGAVTPKLMMEAIDLKDKLTAGAYGNYTEFGLHKLRELETEKCMQILGIISRFIPEDRREEAFAMIEEFENDFYLDTGYYTEYLMAMQ